MKHFIFMKTKLGILLLFLSSAIFSQTNIYFGQKDLTYPQKAGIYETAEDLINDSVKDVGKFISLFDAFVIGKPRGVKFEQGFFSLKNPTIFGFKDNFGNRYRIINDMDFVVLSAGSKWLYSRYYKNYDKYEHIEKSGACIDIILYYSNGINSELKEIKKWDKTPSKEANEKLFITDAEISKQYMSDVSDDYDPHYKNGCIDHLERIIHYTDLYNKKHPK